MASDMRMFSVDKFYGVNEAADGFTELRMGEASKMENFAITDAFNLTLRPGIRRVDAALAREPYPILAAWGGYVEDGEYLVVVDYTGETDRIFLYAKDEKGGYDLHYQQFGVLGLESAEDAMVKIFSFGGKLYIMSAGNTVVYKDGAFSTAEVYVPLVIVGAAPAGGGTALESLNMLSPLRRMDFSADGESTAYVLPEEAVGVTAIVIDNVECAVDTAGAFDADAHTFTFNEAPAKGVGNVEFTYTTDAQAAEAYRMRVVKMRLAETYNGSTDTRLFMAGDGSNVCYYSGVPYSGDVSALYFPAMNEVAVDMSGSPVTGLVRHYSKLVVFKPDGAYTITYEPVTLSDGSTIAGFFLRSANREFGNDAMGQIQTVNNHPRTISKGGIYEWKITASYYKDERYAVRVSDPVEKSLNSVDPGKIVTCDDNYSKTYYVFLNDTEGTVLVNRYALTQDGIWSIYKSGLCKNVRFAMMHGGAMAFATEKELFYFKEGTALDAAEQAGGQEQAIPAVWESGQMAFGADYRQKYSSKIYVSMLPEFSSGMTVTAATDRRESYIEKAVGQSLFSFDTIDFSAFSFVTNKTPKIQRVRLKVKKFVYYKLIFKVDQPGARATVLGYDQQVRFGSMAKR